MCSAREALLPDRPGKYSSLASSGTRMASPDPPACWRLPRSRGRRLPGERVQDRLSGEGLALVLVAWSRQSTPALGARWVKKRIVSVHDRPRVNAAAQSPRSGRSITPEAVTPAAVGRPSEPPGYGAGTWRSQCDRDEYSCRRRPAVGGGAVLRGRSRRRAVLIEEVSPGVGRCARAPARSAPARAWAVYGVPPVDR